MDLSGCSIIITSTCFIGFLYIILFKSSCVMIILLCFASFDKVSNLTTITHLKVATRGYTTKVPFCHTSLTHRGCTNQLLPRSCINILFTLLTSKNPILSTVILCAYNAYYTIIYTANTISRHE